MSCILEYPSRASFVQCLVCTVYVKLNIANFARIICPGYTGARINLLARTVFRSFDITRLSLSNKI